MSEKWKPMILDDSDLFGLNFNDGQTAIDIITYYMNDVSANDFKILSYTEESAQRSFYCELIYKNGGENE